MAKFTLTLTDEHHQALIDWADELGSETKSSLAAFIVRSAIERRYPDRFPQPALPDGLRIQNLGEPYSDALIVEAFLKDRTVAAEANSLLCSTLYRRRDDRRTMVEELARKRGIGYEEMWDQIVTGEAQQMMPEQYSELKNSGKSTS